ncbi:tyrosine-type recombinase/integrase [Shimia thalassica]|uniref:tyrosine-type recombinase/integrase n=1 Tax=Shimia thalassica TaxID=1715693 RepID=UPI0026E32BE1|nr:site-specific integrase [Shimia thalassica]MDO6483571.1 site-specific integrase [Shimia thalassica]
MASISKLPSGKYRVQVRKSGVYRASTFSRKADAKIWATQMELAIEGGASAGTIKAPKSVTLGDLIDGYLADVETGRTTKSNLSRIKKSMGTIPVADLSAVHLSDFVSRRRQDGVGGVTLAGDLSNLSSVLKWGRRIKNIDLNERLAMDARSGLTAARINTRSTERDRIPTEDELDRILSHIENNPRQTIPVGTIIRFARASAMRLSEIVGLRIEDISWNQKTVLIRERKDPQNKSNNNQTVPLLGDAYDIAREAAKGRSEGLLFPYKAISVGAVFTRATRKLGIEDLHFHDLRHLAITELFRAGLPIQLVAVVSGHKDWKHLKRYTQLGADDVHKALDQLQSK